MIAQYVIQLHQNTFAFRWRDISDGYVAGECVALRAETPDVKIVHIQNALDSFHAGADLVELDAARGSFEKNVEGFTDDIDAGPEDESGNDEGEGGIDPGAASEKDSCASGDDGGGGEGVPCHVEEGAAHIDVARATPQEGSNDAVHDDACGGDTHHQLWLDGNRSAETVEGLDGDPDRDHDQGCRVDEGGENSGTLVAESLGVVAGAALEVNGYEAEKQGQEVGGVVTRLREQGEGVGAEAEDKGDSDVGEGSYEGEAKYGLCP